jgi:hypothetical protein
MKPNKISTNKNLQYIIPPHNSESWLDYEIVNLLNINQNSVTPESDLHVVCDKPFTEKVKKILIEKGFQLYVIDSPLIATKAVSAIRFGKNQLLDGYNLFQELLLHKDLFGADNGFTGYMEFESRGSAKENIIWSDYHNPGNLKIDLPFLDPQPVSGTNFKKGDLHFSVKKIDARLQKILIDVGFYFADFIDKEDGKNISNQIYTGLHRLITIQNSKVADTLAIKKKLIEFVNKVGGAEGAVFDEPTLAYVRTKQNAVPPCSDVKVR